LLIKSWILAGAQIIGGCCGIGADEILNLKL
jgi:S-methylmethionine-dependent homocysteine/selenocysteine methylase